MDCCPLASDDCARITDPWATLSYDWLSTALHVLQTGFAERDRRIEADDDGAAAPFARPVGATWAHAV